MEQKLTDYLINKYAPVALILHGSRANGYAREHSDWDFVILTNADCKPLTREMVFGANIEIKQILLPVSPDTFLGFFFRPENVKILYDPESRAVELLEKNTKIIEKGNGFTEADISKRNAFLLSALDGIQDYHDDPLCLFDKKINFYSKIVESWFRFHKKEFEPSHYIAFPIIKKEDPEFYTLIEEFVKADSAHDLLKVGHAIIKKLFPGIV